MFKPAQSEFSVPAIVGRSCPARQSSLLAVSSVPGATHRAELSSTSPSGNGSVCARNATMSGPMAPGSDCPLRKDSTSS